MVIRPTDRSKFLHRVASLCLEFNLPRADAEKLLKDANKLVNKYPEDKAKSRLAVLLDFVYGDEDEVIEDPPPPVETK